MDFIASAPAATLLTVVGLSGALYYIAKMAYPQPLPGIPYDKIAASRLLGDVPTARKAVKETGDAMEFFTRKAEDLQSPIFQFFFLPFTKPKVVIADYRESRDIMVHRIKEFDRGDALIDFFQPLLRTSQLISKTDETWTYHRRLVQDTMSPSFLKNVAAPNMYNAFARLLDLWQRKVVLAGGRPFAVADDLSAATFDGVLAFTFGGDFGHTATEPLMKALDKADSAALTHGLDMDEEVHFPAEKMHDDVSCFHILMAQMEKVAKIPVVKLAWLMVGSKREFRRQQQHKSVVIQRQIDEAVVSMGSHRAVDNGDWVKHAVDHVVDRECRIAAREGRQPNYNAPELADEVRTAKPPADAVCANQGLLFTFIVAGHDTTATATAWAVKILTKYPGVQTKLRTALYETHADAKAEGRRPTAKELTDGTPSYMEAFMAELFRYQSPTPILGRTATCDSVVLGHRIPKGTNVTFLVRGPSIHMPAFAIDESLRTATAVRDAIEHPLLESDDMDEFRPERWYVAKEGSAERLFDGSKWPNATFGMGKRGCFGKRLAHLEFRMILTMILWEFELLPCPVALSSWAGQPKIAYRPKQCYVRMRAVLGDGDRA